MNLVNHAARCGREVKLALRYSGKAPNEDRDATTTAPTAIQLLAESNIPMCWWGLPLATERKELHWIWEVAWHGVVHSGTLECVQFALALGCNRCNLLGQGLQTHTSNPYITNPPALACGENRGLPGVP